MRCLGVFIIANNQGTPKAKTGKAGAMIQHQPTPDSTHSSGQTLAEWGPSTGSSGLKPIGPEEEEPDLWDHSASQGKASSRLSRQLV